MYFKQQRKSGAFALDLVPPLHTFLPLVWNYWLILVDNLTCRIRLHILITFTSLCFFIFFFFFRIHFFSTRSRVSLCPLLFYSPRD